MGVLAYQGPYSYTIWAQPMGEEKLEISGQADDVDFQQEIGMIVPSTIEDPLCYTVAECERVALHELGIVQMQRNRVKFSKLTHLQDELGDTISIPHPYTGQVLNVFITALTRRFKRGEWGGGDGYFIDEIEGARA
jgi:hypothetical protein